MSEQAATTLNREAEAEGLSLADYLAGRAASGATPKIVRKWTLAELVPGAILRMYDIGMGVQTFNTPTAAGNVVVIEAPPAVQRAALHDIISIGLPAQVGIVDDEGNALPGVIALGEYDMIAAQELAHGPRFAAHGGIAGAIEGALHEDDRVAEVLPPKASGGYELPAEHELVVVDEGIGAVTVTQEDAPPAPITEPDEPTPEQVALAKHRERMKKSKHKPVPTAPSTVTEGLRD